MKQEHYIKNCKSIGLQIRNFREAKKLSQEQLASRTGLATGTIGKIERGENIPKADTLFRISYELDIPCKLLFEEETLDQWYYSPQVHRLFDYLKNMNDDEVSALCTIAKKMCNH
nr:helix-turn-helix transcriptional regulator [Eubacterium sp.]